MQTSYSHAPAASIEGALADSSVKHVDSAILEGAASAGLFVVQGTGDQQARVPASAAQAAQGLQLGFVIYSPTREQIRNGYNGFQGVVSGGAVPFADKETVSVLRRGRIFVKMEDAHTAGDPLFVRVAAGAGGTVLGASRTDADTATAVEVKGAVVRSTGAAGALAIVEINLPA